MFTHDGTRKVSPPPPNLMSPVFRTGSLICQRLNVDMLDVAKFDPVSGHRSTFVWSAVDMPTAVLVCSNSMPIFKLGSRVSSGSIVSDYGLDDRAIGVRSPAEAKDFSSSLCVQNGSGAHPASCTVGTGGPFPGGKARPGRDADHSPHLVPRS
jgi:hypothetical protein